MKAIRTRRPQGRCVLATDMVRMLDANRYSNAFLRMRPFKFKFTRASTKADGIIADARIRLADSPDGEGSR